MKLAQIEKRVEALEATVRQLARTKPLTNRAWYRTHAGRFADNPAFEEIVKLGRTYRKSQQLRRRSSRS